MGDYGFQGELFDSLLNADRVEVMRGASVGQITWETLQSETDTLVGERGPPGLDGADSTVAGPQGNPGLDGDDSTVPGPQGPPGNDGADSTVAGPPGAPGLDGDDGVRGARAYWDNLAGAIPVFGDYAGMIAGDFVVDLDTRNIYTYDGE